MNFVSKSEEILQKLVLVVFLLAGSIVGVAAAQQKPKTPPPAPKPSAPHVSTPARSSTSRPSTATHSSTTGARPGTARPGTTNGRTATGTAARNGTGVRGKTGTGPVGRNGAASGMNNRGGANMGGGGHGAMAKTVNRPAPGRQVSLRGGGTANIRPNGQIRSINRNGMHIEHGLNGSRRIESTHNGAHIVTTGRNSGYVQRAYVTRGGRSYVSRTTIINHRGVHQRIPVLFLSWPPLLRLPSWLLLSACVLRVGLQSLASTGLLRMGLGWLALVRILRRILCSLPCVSFSCFLAYGLPHCRKLTSGLPSSGGSERRRRKQCCRKQCVGRAAAAQRGQ